MRRISYWLLGSISAVVLLVGFDASRHGGALTATAPTAVTSGQGTTSSGRSSGTPAGGGNHQPKNPSAGGTGTRATTADVTGDVVQTQWGPVQVQIAVRNGTIDAVKILQYPNGNSRDVEIADYALPILIGETTQQQSAQIDMVSGATFTSEGYLQSLQSALDRAGL